MKLVVVGSIAIDEIETSRERRDNLLGGSVSYACAAASFFTKTGMVGVVGDDFSDDYTGLYSDLGIDMAGLERVSGKTFRWSGVYDKDMINRQTRSTDLNVFESFSPTLPGCYRKAPYLLLGNISPSLQLEVFSQAEEPEFVVADTMDLWINTDRDALMEVIARVNMLTLNDSEAHLLIGHRNLRKCAEEILAMGPQYVVLKKGEHGAMLVSESGIFLVPAFPVTVLKDPTGAGDSFAGGFLGFLAGAGSLDDSAMRESLLRGSVVASFGVEEFSLDRLEKLTRSEIDERVAALKKMISV
ncbi:MAG: sugar kinase [Lentisphaerae bacterium]|nr:sugar kinase [Lentisphaerota bacterium]